jgi:hypothetical protein
MKRRLEMGSKLYSIGHNISGYMSESQPYITSDFEAAKEALMSDVESFAESLWSGLTGAPITTLTDEQRECLSMIEPEAKVCLDHPHPDITDRDKETLQQVLDCDTIIKEINELTDPTEYTGYVEFGSHSEAYWIVFVSREDAGISDDLEGDELDDALEKLNDQF